MSVLTNSCDLEPIHVPGSIQPHGVLLVLDRNLDLKAHAGDVRHLLGVEPSAGASIGCLTSSTLSMSLARLCRQEGGPPVVARLRSRAGAMFDVAAHRSGDFVLVEFELGGLEALSSTELLAEIDEAGVAFERTANLADLCERAATEFRRVTGYDRVMLYRFLEDEAGTVLAEDRIPDLPAFLHHHFPASDIPKQARKLYMRNRTRVIPDVDYEPALLQPNWEGGPLDMSDCNLRSVSPVHVQYLKNMGVGASASISIVVDDVLWGLIACHHREARRIPYERRAACKVLAGSLARQIKARQDADLYRDRIRLRGFEDDVVAAVARRPELAAGLHTYAGELGGMLKSDGVAIVYGSTVMAHGSCPPDAEVLRLARWLANGYPAETYATDELSAAHPEAGAYAAAASGMVAVTVSSEEPFSLFWFRAETIETVKWAGNPHKSVELAEGEILTPRSSFEDWSEYVRGRSLRWTLPEVESAGRLRRALLDLRQARRVREVNAHLSATLADKERLLDRNEVLLREVNHRVQNSLSLVSSFLMLQKRGSEDQALRSALDEAQRRVMAISLVHRRLYRGENVETISLDRYLGEMRDEMVLSMGEEWESHLTLDASPTIVATDKAVSLGLIVTELVINANKYAYGGRHGPIAIALREDRENLRLSVSDRGRGTTKPSGGFGTRMMDSLVQQLGGQLEYLDNRPGLRVTLTAPTA